MALIIEVLHPDGARSRHALNGNVLTLGRALGNDVVLDDPYVDASHARLSLDDNGSVLVEDLGSVNGLVSGEERIFGRTVVRPGGILRVGRTTLRFRDPNELVPPALLDRPAAANAPVVPSAKTRWFTSTPAGLGIAVLALVAFGVSAWLRSSGRSSASSIVSASLGFAAIVTIWAGLWSLASRIIVHQFRFLGHLSVASAVALGGLAWGVTDDWLEFFFPNSSFIGVFGTLALLVLVGVLVAGHLALTSVMPRRRQWKVAGIVAATVIAIGMLSALSKDDSFSDVPKYPASLKPIAANLVPTQSIDQFENASKQLKDEVDQLMKK
jgi:hypothetical protein